MTTLPPPATKSFPEDSLESKVYAVVENYKENIPIPNDRNRLGYNLYKYMRGEGDAPEVSVKNTKIKLAGISEKELAKKISDDLKSIKA